MFRAVIFDFGGVVVEWSMRALFEQFFAPDELDRFLDDVLTPAENLRCDLGTPLAVVVAELTDRHPEHATPLAAWRDRWIETIPGTVPGTVELIDDLRGRGIMTLGLSNFSAETFPMCRARYDVFDRFDDIVISGEVGMAKPSKEIFHLLLERNSLRPDEAVFFDDSPANVDGAREAGLTAFLFHSAAAARLDLRTVGLVP